VHARISYSGRLKTLWLPGLLATSLLFLSSLRAQDAKFAADNLKYSRDFYSKVHFVAIANFSLGSAGTAEFKYDRYPNGGPERIQCGDGEFARKDGNLAKIK
jgi:hypothetical protein